MNDIKKHITKGLKWTLFAVGLVVAISFSAIKQGDRECASILITIDERAGNYFVGEEDILNLMTQEGDRFILGTSFEELNLKHLESEIRSHPFVERADVYKDLKGNLLVDVKQSRPIARLLVDGNQRYIGTQGQLLPLSDRYTARVPLIYGKWADELVASSLDSVAYGKEVFELLEYVRLRPFWKAQVAHLEIGLKGDVIIHPQVGKQYIEFGKPRDVEEKFKKLKIFYKQILPRKGWNSYERVNLAYGGQIICE